MHLIDLILVLVFTLSDTIGPFLSDPFEASKPHVEECHVPSHIAAASVKAYCEANQ